MYVVKLGDEVYELLDWQPPPGKPAGATITQGHDAGVSVVGPAAPPARPSSAGKAGA